MRLPVYTLLLIFADTWMSVSGQNDKSCEMLTSGIQRCYASIGIKLPQENLLSIMSVPLDYLGKCWMDFTEFFFCYDSIIAMCPTYLDVNPLMMSSTSLRSMLFGMCQNKEIYLTGLKEVESKSDKFHSYMQNCFALRHFSKAVEAQAAGNWTDFCGNLPNEISCVETVLNAFDSGEEFLLTTKKFLYSIQPITCMDDSVYWDWLRRYGLSKGSKMVLSLLTLLMAVIIGVIL